MTNEEIRQKYPRKIPAAVAAKELGISFVLLAKAIDDGKIPFGINVGVEGCRNRYLIPTERYLSWRAGEDLKSSVPAPQNPIAFAAQFFTGLAREEAPNEENQMPRMRQQVCDRVV